MPVIQVSIKIKVYGNPRHNLSDKKIINHANKQIFQPR
jgi:hypothetical protein